ncbi:hypothetical protein PTKIN_Ptkin18bG0117500 [Pterospermum kingtungense]
MRKKPRNLLGKYNWLISSGDKEKFWHISMPLDESIPNSHKKTVWTCSYGWLLVSQEKQAKANESYRSYQFCVWEPESSKVIDLPPLKLNPKQRICAATLLSPPDNPGSTVLLFDDVLRYFIFYKFSDKQWTKRWFGKEMEDIGDESFINKNYIAHCDGKLYAATLSYDSLMVIEETRPKVFKLKPLNCDLPSACFSSPAPSNCPSDYLLDYFGQPCFVEVLWGGVNQQHLVGINVSKLEFRGDGMDWIKEKSAEGRAFFLSDNCSFSCLVDEPEIDGGCIYLCANNRVYTFNIEDQSVSVSLALENCLRQKTSLFLAMPDLNRICNLRAKSKHTIAKLEEEGIVIEEKGEAQAKSICELSLDILGSIAKHLYLDDYFNFRSVCNTFSKVAPSIKWREASLKLKLPPLSPWLVFPKGNLSAIHTFIDPHFGGRYLIKIPESLLDTQICYSNDGWLLMCNHDLMVFYHPLKLKFIRMSQVSREHKSCFGYGLSSSPTSADCTLVALGFNSIYYICRSGEEWNESEFEGVWNTYDFPDYDFEPNHSSPVYFDGAFYFLDRNGKLGVFRLNNGQVSWEILRELENPWEKMESPGDGFCYSYLSECGGNLLSVFVMDQLVHIYKLNFTSEKAWEKVTSLGNHALFLSPSSSFSVIPSSSDMENKVYFRKLYGVDIVYYCLSTDKFYTCGNKEVVADFNNTTEFIYSTWIEPTWQ